MKKRLMRKRLAISFMAVTMAASGVMLPPASQEVHAETLEVSAVGRTGTMVTTDGVVSLNRGLASITVNPNSVSQSLIGKTFHVYKLFHAENSVGLESINYTFNEDCKPALQTVVGKALGKTAADVTEYEVIDYIQSLNNFKVEGAQTEQKENGYYSEFRYFIEELRDELAKYGSRIADTIQVTSVKADGSIVIDGLDYGYYVIDEVTDNQDDHSASSLCIVDTANPFADVKVKSDYPNVVKKIQEDDNQETVGNNGWNDMADYEIGQTVPFKFTSNIPNINGYDTYYYAWHDVMDEALTFHSDSVQLVISDGAGTEYKLSSSEFRVAENVQNTDGTTDTFVVSVQDIKSIVDTHFNNIDSLGHNTYGQTVTLTYTATLNDNAALDTGIPGYENDVRLEFSNDPDSQGEGKTGYTPWDTVVCFTYRLDGLKVNNYDAVLENAKFRLYLDADCTDEVYVKEGTDGYIVINDDSANGVPSNAVEMSSDENGVFNIIGLDCGTYYLKETDSPAGYRELLDPIVITISPTFTDERNEYVKGDGAAGNALLDLDFSAHVKEFLDGLFHEEDTELDSDVTTGTGNLTVVNTVGAKLPVTGSVATLAMFCIGSGLMIVSGMKMRKKNNQKEEE